jgi:hypothetical protein
MTETLRKQRQITETYKEPIEHELYHERDLIVPRFDILTVSGPRGGFKTAVMEMLTGVNTDPRNLEAQAKFHLDGLRHIPLGLLIREEVEAQTGKPFIEDFLVRPEDDKRYDDEQISIMENARRPRLVVIEDELKLELRDAALAIEGRYSGFLAADVAERMAGTRYAPKIERILFYSSSPEEQSKIETKRELKKRKTAHLSPEQLEQLGLLRELELSQKAQRLFPEIVRGQYIFDPNMVTKKGKIVYTVIIDTAGKLPPQILEELFRKLKDRNILFEIARKDFAYTSDGENAYEVIKSLSRCQGLMADNPCNRYAIKTLDVYLGRKLQAQIPSCSNDHSRNIRQRLNMASEHDFTYSKNGFPINQNPAVA